MIEATLIDILTANSSLYSLIGGRIRPFTDTTVTAKPCLTYWRPNTQRPYSNDGPTGQGLVTFQLDAWAADAATVYAVMHAVRQALDGFSGIVNSTQIDFIHVIDQQDQLNTPVRAGEQKGIQRSTMQILISYTEDLIAVGGSAFDNAFS